MSIFKNISNTDYLFENEHFFCIWDKYPVSPGHLLIISKREASDYFSLNHEEQKNLPEVIAKSKTIVEAIHEPDGYNLGMNCGKVAGQTVFHFHFHVMPRYEGDMEDPRGGIRHAIAGKGQYI